MIKVVEMEPQIDNNRILTIDDDESILALYRSSLADSSEQEMRYDASFAEIERLLSDEQQEQQEQGKKEGGRQTFRLVQATQGEQGVKLAAEALQNEKPFACALIDMRMPPGIDGLQTAKELRALDGRIFIVIITAYSDERIEKMQRELSHDMLFARKPIYPEELYQFALNASLGWDRHEALRLLQQEMEEKVRSRTEEIERLSEQAQFSAFQAGLVEMSSSVIHNIGNAVGGMGGLSWKIGDELKSINTVSAGLAKLQQECSSISEEKDLPESLRQKISKQAAILQAAINALHGITDDRLKRVMDTLSESIEYVKEVISLQQASARPDSNAVRFDFEKVVDDAITILQDRLQQERIEVVKSIEKGVGQILLPRNQLMQLLINLLKNSIEAIQAQREHGDVMGRIEISLSTLLSDANKQGVELRVTDNGIGCSREQQSRLFTSGFSTEKKGSGLGLHSVANFVLSLDGEIHFESKGEGRGATVRVWLPQ